MRPTHFRFVVVRSFSLLVAISPILSGALLVLFFNVVLDPKRAMAQAVQPQLTTIDFSDQSGPSLFSQADPPLTIGGVTFSGGQILTAETNNTVDTATVYGTGNDPAGGVNCINCLSTMTIDFASRVANVSLTLLNGLTYTVTYTVEDDQGGTLQITIVANTDGGEATITLPESGIRQINISADPDIWDFSIGSVQFSVLGVELIDPVASGFLSQYANQFGISTDTSVLANGGNQVIGASADGVTELLIRLPAAAAGATYALSLVDETGQFASVSADGGLFQLTDTPDHASGSLTVNAVDTSQGPMAFAAYVAPTDFERTSADDKSVNRNITLQVLSTGLSNLTTANILIVRPPVVLVHGLWGSLSDFDGFSQVVADPMNRFGTPFRVDYSYWVDITAESPSYVSIFPIEANSLGLAYNGPGVAASLRQFITSYAQTQNVAAVQADVVGHSMGGLMARALALTSGFADYTSYGKGTINKLITVGTPHLGSELAIDLLESTSSCSRGFLAVAGMFSFDNVTLDDGTVVGGAVNDLQGNGDGTELSDELSALQATPLPFPIAYVGATSNATNWADLDSSVFFSETIHSLCPSSDIIANNLTPTGWTTLFSGQPSDSVVRLNSQFNGLDSGAGGPFSGIIHSEGLESLNFVGPAELDSASTIGTEVVNLLNEMKQGADFHVYAGAQ